MPYKDELHVTKSQKSSGLETKYLVSGNKISDLNASEEEFLQPLERHAIIELLDLKDDTEEFTEDLIANVN